MDVFLRIALLGACVAAGIGVAVCVALSVTTTPPAIEPVTSQLVASTPLIEEQGMDKGPPPLLAKVTPAPAPYSPRMGQETKTPIEKPSDKVADENSAFVTERIDVIKMQAARAQQPHASPILEQASEEEKIETPTNSIRSRLAETPSREPLPEPIPRTGFAPIIERDEGDDRLRVTVQNSDIRDILELLSQQGDLNILATNNVTGNVSASLVGVDVESALLAILRSTGFVARREGQFIYVGTPEDFRTMDQTADAISTRRELTFGSCARCHR